MSLPSLRIMGWFGEEVVVGEGLGGALVWRAGEEAAGVAEVGLLRYIGLGSRREGVVGWRAEWGLRARRESGE